MHARRRRLHVRRRGGARAPARRRALQAPRERVTEGAAGTDVRPVPRHPLQARQGVLARGAPAFRAHVLPPGPLLRAAGADPRARRRRRRATSGSIPTPSTTAPTRSTRRRCAVWASRAFACITRSTRRSTRTRCWCSWARATSVRSGKGQRYGLSARGLALDTAVMSGEEFPRFIEFWIERPEPRARELTIYALLDSPRAAGAYRFVLQARRRNRRGRAARACSCART